LMFLISGLVFIGFSNEVNAQTSPLYQYPITFTNSPSGSGSYQQLLNLTMSSYNINTTNPDNFLFSYTNGTFIYAWIESYTSTNILVWLNLLNGTTEIYLNVYSMSTNEFTNATGYLGEAPQLSPTYAEYDNGALIFNYYTNFSGTSLPSNWTSYVANGTVTVDNGVNIKGSTISEAGENGIAYMASSGIGTPPYYVDYGVQQTTSNNSGWSWNAAGLSSYLASSDDLPWGGTGGTYLLIDFADITATSVYDGFGGTNTNGNLSFQPTNYTYTGVFTQNITLTSYYTYYNYTQSTGYATGLTSDVTSLPFEIMVGQTEGVFAPNGQEIYWFRIRSYLPNGMPSYSIGTNLLYTVTVNESGLPSNTEWYFNLTNGQSFSTNTSSLSFTEYNGTYTYYANSTNPFYNSVSNSFTVNNANLILNITFSMTTYNITVNESGLPSGTEWYFNVSLSPSLTFFGNYTSSTTSLTFSAPNNTYTFTLGTVNQVYYSSTTTYSSFTVNGSSLNLSVQFGIEYNVTFNEIGLANPQWNIQLELLNYIGNSTPIDSYQSYNSSTTSITILTLSANYSYVLNGSSQSQSYQLIYGNLSLSSNLTINITFNQVFNITFTESGLPSGTEWYLNLTNGQTFSSNTTTISFSELNGTYTVINPISTSIANYSVYLSNTSIIVNGTDVYENITFYYLYPITLTESGLPSGTEWNAILTAPNLWVNSTNTTSLTVYGSNGSLTINYLSALSYFQANVTLSTINGASLNLNIDFIEYYNITFIENGLSQPNNYTWYINVSSTIYGQRDFYTTNSNFTYSTPNGTYYYTIGINTSNYIPVAPSEEFNVSGNDITINITFYEMISVELIANY
ncbi:MAG: hypothetical protein QXU98_14685, partial [Candidatus Parvarchaeota archaeon]